MENRSLYSRGCLLGLAVGDAMGYPVDKKSWPEISEAYGPNGLLGFDLTGSCADVTSHTQIAAFVCNGLLLGATRQDAAQYSGYLALALREWAKSQQFRTNPERTRCWVAQVPELRRRLCMDTRILDALARPTLGTPEAPMFRGMTPAVLTGAVAVGMFGHKLTKEQLLRLGAEVVAFTHGTAETFLCGSFLSCVIADVLEDPRKLLTLVFTDALNAVCDFFGESYPEATALLRKKVEKAMELTRDPELSPLAAMTVLECVDAVDCLAGAVYACCIHPANFDEAMIASVNHSGRSCATAAITGAILGAALGKDCLPDFYLESLEAAAFLEELAQDTVDVQQITRIFDDSWDQKYVQGLPV